MEKVNGQEFAMTDVPSNPGSDEHHTAGQNDAEAQLHRREFLATFIVLGGISLILVLIRLFFHA
jgi:hypothetical protein